MMCNDVQVLCEQRVPPPLLFLDSPGAPLTVRGTPGGARASSLPTLSLPPSRSSEPSSKRTISPLRLQVENQQHHHGLRNWLWSQTMVAAVGDFWHRHPHFQHHQLHQCGHHHHHLIRDHQLHFTIFISITVIISAVTIVTKIRGPSPSSS